MFDFLFQDRNKEISQCLYEQGIHLGGQSERTYGQ